MRPGRNDNVLVRVDQNIGNKVRLSVRYNWYDTYNSNIGAIPVAGHHAAARQQEHAGVYTHTLSQPSTTISGSATTASTSIR